MAYGYQNYLLGFMPRRNVLLTAFAIILLVAVWSSRFSRPALVHDFFDDSSSSGSKSKDQSNNVRPPPTSIGPPPIPWNNVDLSDPDAPFVGWPLKRVCDEATWVDGLVYICDNNSGGIGNIRNYIQTCLRYALEAGATGLVVPKIRKRNEEDLADLFTNFLPFSYMFDEKHFRDAFNTNCPQITLYDNITDIPGVTNSVGVVKEGRAKEARDGEGEAEAAKAPYGPKIEMIKPKTFGSREGCDWQDQNRHTDRFGDTFRKWLHDGHGGLPAPSKAQPRLIRFEWGVLWDWPIYRDGPEFAATFGNILRFNDQLLRLGKTALKNMHSFARANGAGRDGRFLGAHLRTESDSMDFWPTYDVQSQAYVEQALARDYRVAYLATGNATEAEKFEGLALERANGMKVVTKTDLLAGKDLEELKSLSWDQQGLVDFVVLLGSEYFVGTMPSSFSVYMAMKRHLSTGGLYTRPYKTGTEGDGLSYLVGNYDKYWQGWLFMWDGMWP